jgi:hypothetical protein
LVAENEQVFDAREFREIGRFENCRYLGLKESIAQSVDMVTYYVKRDTAGERPRQVKVLLLHDVRDCDQMLSEFAEKYSINGVVCYKPSYSLLETETLRSVVFESKLFCVGGSFGEEPAGCIRVSAELEEIFSSAQ